MNNARLIAGARELLSIYNDEQASSSQIIQSQQFLFERIPWLCDALEAALSREAKLRSALEEIWNSKNSPSHHAKDCELHQYDWEEGDGEIICDCGYWSSEYPMLKLRARAALAEVKDG